MPKVTGFLPSTSGLHFANSFSHIPLKTIELPHIPATVTLGDAAHGLCGGMVFTVLDYFLSGATPPPSTAAPSGGPLFDHLVQRLFDSWNIPWGVARYLYLMSPGLPDYSLAAGRSILFAHSRASVVVNDEWPKIKRDIDSNQPSPIGVVECKSADLELLGKNHQVLVYGYDLAGSDLTLYVYDPNAPDDDSARLSLSIAGSNHPCQFTCTTIPEVYCLFRNRYTKKAPPSSG